MRNQEPEDFSAKPLSAKTLRPAKTRFDLPPPKYINKNLPFVQEVHSMVALLIITIVDSAFVPCLLSFTIHSQHVYYRTTFTIVYYC